MEDLSIKNEQLKNPKFRELEKVERWAAVLSTDLDKNLLIQALRNYARQSSVKLFGYIEETEKGTEYHLNRYPRKKYDPISTSEQLNVILTDLGSKLGQVRRDDKPIEKHSFKTIMALGEGYGGKIFHKPEEVIDFLGQDFLVKPVIIYSVNDEGEYSAEAVVVEGDFSQLDKIYELADRFKQHRFSVEDLKEGTINLVETRWCEDPDKI